MNKFNLPAESLQNLKILQSALPKDVNPELKSELEREIERREAAQRLTAATNLAIERQLMKLN
ncbi:MAG: hypothetical protein KGI54_18505 [Pseudomonadota bacterium]|nr:hypothetical protein [Pseudomonadota bacterium]